MEKEKPKLPESRTHTHTTFPLVINSAPPPPSSITPSHCLHPPASNNPAAACSAGTVRGNPSSLLLRVIGVKVSELTLGIDSSVRAFGGNANENCHVCKRESVHSRE